jgi:hypothetical protein
MAYRNGTYVAFYAAGTSDPTASDMKYYTLLQAWQADEDNEFYFVNSHDKVAAIRDSSSRRRLQDVLAERLRNSKNMVLILGQSTQFDTDWVPFEISYAVDSCHIPIIAAYPDYEYVLEVEEKRRLWPDALAQRIDSKAARVIHIPFKREPLTDAVNQFSHDHPPTTSVSYYSREAYASFGITVR